MQWATKPGTQAKGRLSRISWSSRGLGCLGADKLVQTIGCRRREEGPREETRRGEGCKSSMCKQEGHLQDRTQCPERSRTPRWSSDRQRARRRAGPREFSQPRLGNDRPGRHLTKGTGAGRDPSLSQAQLGPVVGVQVAPQEQTWAVAGVWDPAPG